MFGSFGGGNEIYTGDIPASLRFRGRSASAYASKTFGTPTSQNSWAFSCFVKFSEMPTGSNYQPILSAGPVATSSWPGETLYIYQDGTLAYYAATVSGTHNVSKRSSRVFRDPTGWVHIFVRKTAAANSGLTFVRLWVNNEEVTSWAVNTYTGTQASVPNYINVASTSHALGRNFGEYLQGYMSRVCFVDNGGSLLPTDFGYFNTDINEWVSKTAAQVKAVVDAGGTNSFMLDFDDPNFATYNVGKDYSSKGNHWTPNNFSLTAGTTYDHMLDVPGNSYATLNPLHQRGSNTFSDGNIGFVHAAGTTTQVGSVPISTGKWYWEIVYTAVSAGALAAIPGIVKTSISAAAMSTYASGGVGYSLVDGSKYINGTSTAYGATCAINDVIGVAIDCGASTVTFYKNNTSQGAISIDSGAEWYPASTNGTGSATETGNFNFGQRPFTYTPPTGFKALCQRNMPDPAILNPEKHFDVRLHVGNAASQKVTSDFKPGLVWIKRRNISATHSLFDEIRGASVSLHSETTGADDSGTSLNSLDADGFTLGNNANTNSSPDTFVDWLWKAGGAAVTNNAGSISSQVSANGEAGFSIVTYTGNLTAAGTATVGHGLGRKPSLIISKSRNNAGGDSGQWCVRHQALDINSYKRLNTSDYIIDSVANGNMSAGHTTSVFQTNWTSGINSNGGNFVAYCFADIPGYSKAFWATGNGVADGPFIELGFKPKFLLIVGGPAGAYWNIIDCTRSPYNVADLVIYPNTSGVENNTYAKIDILSSGIKCRAANDNVNYNGYGIIGIAFADVPAKYALAR